jgi:AraC-like DNA-binding protein
VETPKLYIKGMVSLRCKIAVKEELKKLGLHYIFVELGEVDIMEDLTVSQREQLKENLLKIGLELMDDKKSILVERIKNIITEMVQYTEELPDVNYSVYIADKLRHDYTYLSNIFSEVNGISIKQYIINQKIEKAKEFIMYDELTLSEIAFKLHYSSIGHFSNQFKKITGVTPSFYKGLKQKRRINLENI